MAQIFYPVQQMVQDLQIFGTQIISSGWIPNVIYKVSRGGDILGNNLSEVLAFYGIKNRLSEVHVRRFNQNNHEMDSVDAEILGYILPPERIRPGSNILIVDDLPDKKKTLAAVIADILDLNPEIRPDNIKVGVYVHKDLVNEQTPKTIRFRRLYHPLHKGYDETPIERPFAFSKPDYCVHYLRVEDSSDPKTWVDFGAGELVKMTPAEIGQRYGTQVRDSLFAINLAAIEQRYGTAITDVMRQNIAARRNGDDVKEIKIQNGH